ncbi:MAG: hypothetical protein ABIF71_03915 [Planctomycetota bacterium]
MVAEQEDREQSDYEVDLLIAPRTGRRMRQAGRTISDRDQGVFTDPVTLAV